MFSRVFGAAARGAVRCRTIINTQDLRNFGIFEGKNLVEGFKPSFGVHRGICSVISHSGVSQGVGASLGVSNGGLLTKSIKPSVLNGHVPTRTVIKWTKSKGKRQCVKTVLKRFYRLNWGIWIRTKASRHKRRWKKRGSNARRSRQHVFCNATQSWLLDKMVTRYWRKPKFWVDDPYTPYHKREEYWATRTKPLP